MRKLTSLLLLFLCGMVTMWADYSVGKLLTADEVNAGVSQVCLNIDQDRVLHCGQDEHLRLCEGRWWRGAPQQ